MSSARRRTPLAALAAGLLSLADAACENASTLVRATDASAIAYTDACFPRPFDVIHAPGFVWLNLSHLDLERVQDYPPVNKLQLNDNFLTTFQSSPASESLMEDLDLHDNRIADLSSLQFPRRLSKLNLATNKIVALNSKIPWPASMELKWLSLDGNGIGLIDADTFTPLTTLTYLSLSNTTLNNLGDVTFPLTLSTLNLSYNRFTSDKLKFVEPPVALQTLDLSGNLLGKFPDFSAFTSLVDLNLANNGMKTIAGVRLPPKLKKLNLSGNILEDIEISQSDVKIFEKLEMLTLATDSLLTTCKSSSAKRQAVRDRLEVCVLSDDQFVSPEAAAAGPTSPSNSASPPATTKNPSVLNDTVTSESSKPSHMSSKAMLLLGGGCFGMGLIVAAYVFLVRRDGRAIKGKPSGHPTFAPEASDASSRAFGRHGGGLSEYSNASWVFGSPVKAVGGFAGPNNVVAILEDDRQRRGRGRSKVEDLLVYEIPLDEIMIKEAMSQKHHGSETMYNAEYQGYQVVMHALSPGRGGKLQRGRRRLERDFVEQVRLASLLEHSCIVQFIGITLGSHSQSQRPNLKWKMGVVFEYMEQGSLASVFHDQRTLRDGNQYRHRTASHPAITNDTTSEFSWYPSPQASNADGGSPQTSPVLCKLSIALDVAMALSYLHSIGYAHGDLRAEKVLVNEQGEAKLSGMDIDLAMNVPEAPPTHMDMRASVVKARMKMKSMFQTSISQSPALDSSLLNSQAAANGGIMPMALTSTTSSSMLISAHSRARRHGMHGDVYAFGLLLWELDTMMCVGAMKRLTAAATEAGEEHQLLRFSPECPTEIQFLARRCWSLDVKERPTALDLQEEIVRMLEGRLTTLSQRSASTHRWSRRTNSRAGSSRNGSSSFASSHSSLSFSDYRSSSLVIAETEV